MKKVVEKLSKNKLYLHYVSLNIKKDRKIEFELINIFLKVFRRHIRERPEHLARLSHHASASLRRVSTREAVEVLANQSVHLVDAGAKRAARAQPRSRDCLHSGAHGSDQKSVADRVARDQRRHAGDRVLQTTQ